MRRRLRSIYTPSPLLGSPSPHDNCHADVGPPLRPAPPEACTPAGGQSGPRSCTRAGALRAVRPRRCGSAELSPLLSSPIGECPLPPLRAGPMARARQLRRPQRSVRLKRPVNLGGSARTGAAAGLRSPEVWAVREESAPVPTWVELCKSPGTSPRGRAPLRGCASSGVSLKSCSRCPWPDPGVAGPKRSSLRVLAYCHDNRQPAKSLDFILAIPPWVPLAPVPTEPGAGAATISSVGIGARTPSPRIPELQGQEATGGAATPGFLASGHTVLYGGLFQCVCAQLASSG